MRLPEFILGNIEPILQDWEDFARSLSQGGGMEKLALRNDAEAILRSAVGDMVAEQTPAQQLRKSKGHGGAGGDASDSLDGASSLHGTARFGSGFNINEVVSEYRALRASVLRLWGESLPCPDRNDISDVTRFNEALDQSLAKAVASFALRVDQSRKMFLAILGHDLRNPLGAIKMSAGFAARQSKNDPDAARVLARIDTSVEAISRLILDLLDFAAAGLGTGMPVTPGPVDLERLAREVVEELSAAHPSRKVRLDCRGDLACTADGPRLRQVISNLLSNALTHGADGSTIELSLAAGEADVVLTVHNDGPPIPPELLPSLFEPLVRDMSAEAEQRRRPGSLGLGLYIAREIVLAHGGTIEVTSSAEAGTTFFVRLPRQCPESSGCLGR